MAPADTAKKGGLKITKALKSAARLPVRVASRKGTGQRSFEPQPNEQPLVVLRVQIIGCMQLLAKDRGGTSDPFVVTSVLNIRKQTTVAKKTLNPTYAPKDATFDFPLYLSLADKLGVMEFVVWDKDMLSKEYLGEVALPLDDWFLEKDGTPRPYAWDDPNNKPLSLNLLSSKSNTVATGSIQLKLGFTPPPNTESLMEWEAVYRELVKRSRPSIVSAPATEGVGTVRSNNGRADFADDGGLSSSDSEDDEDDDEDETFVDALESEPITLSSSPRPEDGFKSPDTPTPGNTAPTPTAAATPQLTAPTPKLSTGFIPKMKFPRKLSSRSSSTPTSTSSSSSTPGTPLAASPLPTPILEAAPTGEKKSRKASGTKKSKSGAEYQFEGGNDIVGIVMLEIQSAEDLPRLSNMTRTGWDMDPFVVVSFGKKVFRTRVIRHSRNPVWDEKLLFHVRRYETSFKVQLGILDWDKLSANDHIGDASFDEYKLKLETGKGMDWEAKHAPTISLRAKYQPYDALRQQFWRQYLKQYDADDTNALSQIEITSMLDSLGSTLTHSTIASFFTRFGKNHKSDELTFEEAIQCLETELGRPSSEKKRLDSAEDADTSVVATPILMANDGMGNEVKLDELDFSGPGMVQRHSDNSADRIPAPEPKPTAGMQQPLVEVAAPLGSEGTTPESSDVNDDTNEEGGSGAAGAAGGQGKKKKLRFRKKKSKHPQGDSESSSGNNTGVEDGGMPAVERVINVKSCPLCHRPRMNSKAEMDIITHLAVCASQDWKAVDKIVVGNFVTASQAQRKWYTKVLSKVSSGDYKLGANSANIIVQNRITGQLEEEKMQVFVRLGIRLLYKGASGQMDGARARKLLKSLSIKQGVKYDDPASAAEIPTFIQFHNLNVHEILDPLDSFKSFNEFFYRKLKPSARPVESLGDPFRLVSSADSRLMAFETVNEATRLWIKGRDFTIPKLLGDNYKKDYDRYNGGALVIFRLAPQDYHRFHSPVDGTIGPMTYIAGEYYTVNPQAIRTALDVYGENARKIVPIDSPQFGRVMAVCVGAMMVGSIKTTVEEGENVARGQEFGYFAFGGSTIVMLFEKGTVEWDEDLLINGRASLETLVRVGMGIGKGTRA
ncbi:hypothetical protein EST38_g5632 [Candolleomyces aberdarensis]|uniref:Phosphatidylserine decarboxylase proenzyme 2 n=1 Tax=Candolleomyces aberdarensis TaxID=2316362 RepID=A0A4Q2DM08_9AGAR|nr:hypothetical protein EST38_g5632 [Candolleomyces aberdarensis]